MLKISKQDIRKSIKDKILDLIRAQELKPGDKILSQNELARHLGFPAPTVYKALNELTCEGILYRIKGKGTYIAEKTALHNIKTSQADLSEQSYTVAIYPFENYYGHSYLSELAEGITLGLIKNQMNCKFINRFELENSGTDLIGYMYKKNLDGIILTALSPDEYKYIKLLKENGFAHILINREYPETDSVCTDHYEGTVKLLELLIHMGHRRIACVASSVKLNWMQERIEAYKNTLDKYGLKFDKKLLSEEHPTSNYSNTVKMLSRDKSITALFISTGFMQNRILEKLKEENISIPDKLSVVTFDEIPPLPNTCRITCARQQLLNIGKTAVDILNKRLRFNPASTINIKYNTDILSGASCKTIIIHSGV